MSFRSWFIPHTILQLINRQWWRGLHQWAEKQQWGQKSIALIAFKSCGFQLGHIEPGAVGLKIESVRGFQRARSGAVLRYTLHFSVQHFGRLGVSNGNTSSCADSFAQNNSTRTAVQWEDHPPRDTTFLCTFNRWICFFFYQNVSDSISLVMINGETCMLLVKTFAWQSR